MDGIDGGDIKERLIPQWTDEEYDKTVAAIADADPILAYRLTGGSSAARHSRSRESEAHRSGRRFKLLLLALGDVQQRRLEGAVHRRVGRRWGGRRGEVPRDRRAR